MKNPKQWRYTRQQAGRLVKECRYQRPRSREDDPAALRKEKRAVQEKIRNCCFRKNPTDRAELMVALMGARSAHWVLTYDEDHLPLRYAQVQEDVRRFIRGLRRRLGRAFDYLYCIEGKHGDHRYHVHILLRKRDVPDSLVTLCWPGGGVKEGAPVLLPGKPRDGFYRLARYFTKEARDGMSLPLGSRLWVASRSLRDQLPPPERGKADSGEIIVPEGATGVLPYSVTVEGGQYHYASWIEPEPRARATYT